MDNPQVIRLTTPLHFPVSICIHSAAVELVVFGSGFPPESILRWNEYDVEYNVHSQMTEYEHLLYLGPAEIISIHIKDGHDVESELIKQPPHPRVQLVWADSLQVQLGDDDEDDAKLAVGQENK